VAEVIEVRNLSFQYPDSEPILKNISYAQASGESIALLGPNGSGKTTFALHLNGILQGQGEIRIDNELLTPDSLARIRAKVGFVFQSAENQLFLPTLLEDICFGPRNQGATPAEADAKARAILEELHLLHYADRNPFHLSAGEKRRAALAGVVVMNPKILILDEPTTFLDPPGTRELAALLNRLPMTKLIITHDVPFALRTTTRAAFFDQGQIQATGPTAEIIQRFQWE
jgi:cobalt/nickel transport system ATP-binding protein